MTEDEFRSAAVVDLLRLSTAALEACVAIRDGGEMQDRDLGVLLNSCPDHAARKRLLAGLAAAGAITLETAELMTTIRSDMAAA